MKHFEYCYRRAFSELQIYLLHSKCLKDNQPANWELVLLIFYLMVGRVSKFEMYLRTKKYLAKERDDVG